MFNNVIQTSQPGCDGFNKPNFNPSWDEYISALYESDLDMYLGRQQDLAGNRHVFTAVFSVKRTKLGTYQFIMGTDPRTGTAISNLIYFNPDNITFVMVGTANTSQRHIVSTRANFKDMTGWYHFMCVANGDSSAGMQIWCNGVQMATDDSTDTSGGTVNHWNDGGNLYIGNVPTQTQNYNLDAYLTRVGIHDGVAHTDMSAFGDFNPITGQWEPKDPDAAGWSGNSFYLSGKVDTRDDHCNVLSAPSSTIKRHVNNLGHSPDWAIEVVTAGGVNRAMYDAKLGDGNNLHPNNTATVQSDNQLSFIDGGYINKRVGTATTLWSMESNPDRGFATYIFDGDGVADRKFLHNGPSKPKVVMLKSRNVSGGTRVWVDGITGDNQTLMLNNNSGVTTVGDYWDNANTDAVGFGLGLDNNTLGTEYHMIVFWEVPDFIKFGTFNGTEASVELGFRPKVFLTKSYNVNAEWIVSFNHDSSNCDYFVIDSTDGVVSNSNILKLIGQTTMDVSVYGSDAAEWFYIAIADTTALKEFSQSDFGSVVFDKVNIPDEQNTYSDTPLNNFCVMNGLNPALTGRNDNQGGLDAEGHGTPRASKGSTMFVPAGSKGRWVFEAINNRTPDGQSGMIVGFGEPQGRWGGDTANITSDLTVIYGNYDTTNGQHYRRNPDGSQEVVTSATVPWNAGVVSTYVLDKNTNQIEFYKDGVLIYTMDNIADIDLMPFWMDNTSGAASHATFNFGQRPFLYPPTGEYNMLCSRDLAKQQEVSVPKELFVTHRWTGTQDTPYKVPTPSLFDLFICKQVDSSSAHWRFYVRSNGDGQVLYLNLNNGSFDETTIGYNTRFLEDGIEVTGAVASGLNDGDMVAYAIKAGACSGVFVDTWDGDGSAAVLPHGLGKPPTLMFMHRQDGPNSNWYWSVPGRSTGRLLLGESAAAEYNTSLETQWSADDTNITLNNTSSQFGAGTKWTIVAFTDIAGFLKTGTYYGNGNADGPWLPTGFTPAMLRTKGINTTSNWLSWMDVMNPNNPAQIALETNNAVLPTTFTGGIDVLSQGVKIRSAFNDFNGNGNKYAYWAFADIPGCYSNAK